MDPLFFTIAVGITNGITAILNKIAPELRKFSPLWALQIGWISYCLLAGFTLPNVAYGLVVGLSACGLWSGSRSVATGIVDVTSKE